jgi:hypothetical protein
VLIINWIAARSSAPPIRSVHIPLTTYCLPYMKLSKMPNKYIFTLKMATAMFAETLSNFQNLLQLIPKH